MARVNIKSALNQLQEVQKGYKVRKMCPDDLVNAMAKMINTKNKVMADPINKKYLQKIKYRREYAVPNCYNWSANTTVISGYITKYGRIHFNVYRDSAKKVPYGGVIEKIEPIFA